MGRHIVGPLASVNKRHRLGADQIDRRFHVDPHVRVSIFVDRQTCRGVLDEQMQQTRFQLVYVE